MTRHASTGVQTSTSVAGRDRLHTEQAFSTVRWRAGDSTGEWVAAVGTTDHAVALYVHGGRFQREEDAGAFAAKLSAELGMAVLMPRYRLAPEFPYPAAPRDVEAAYRALLDQGHPASEVVIVGHSVGATLALSALVELAAAGDPLPAAAVLISPITDFTLTGASIGTGDGRDVLTRGDLEAVRDSYLAGADPAAAPQSPLYADLTGMPPLFIACGGDERLLDDAIRFAERADGAGVEVDLDVFEGMPHGFALNRGVAQEALFTRMAAFTRQRFAGDPPASPQPLTIRRVGWAGYVITTEQGTRVLIDPYQSGSEGFHSGLPESPIGPEELYDCDIVAVTHAGFDHRGQAVDIVQGGQAFLVCGPALFQHALEQRVAPDRCAVMVSGVEFRHRDVTIRALDARHSSSMMSGGRELTDQPMSFLLTTSGGTRILCGGDFSLSSDMRTWGELYRPRIAILGIGGLRVGPLTVVELPPADAALAATWLGVETVIPVHYPPGDPAPARLAAELTAVGPHVKVAVLEFGETWTDESHDPTDR